MQVDDLGREWRLLADVVLPGNGRVGLVPSQPTGALVVGPLCRQGGHFRRVDETGHAGTNSLLGKALNCLLEDARRTGGEGDADVRVDISQFLNTNFFG